MTPLPAMDLRPMRDTDYRYVINSWLRSFSAYGAEAREYTGKTRGAFGVDYMPVIRALVARSKVLVLCLADEPDAIIAWMCWEGEVLHYAAVKTAWRRLGVAKKLLADFADMPVQYTHRTRRWVPEGLLVHQTAGTKPLDRWCPAPSGWVYRRWLLWPKEIAA